MLEVSIPLSARSDVSLNSQSPISNSHHRRAVIKKNVINKGNGCNVFGCYSLFIMCYTLLKIC